MKKVKMAILGAGNIANSMAMAMHGISDRVECYAVASRSLEKAKEFAKKWKFEKFYGSYEELVQDPEVELIYVATPHSHHFEHGKLCVEHNKPVLMEKAFTVNYRQAVELITMAEEKKVFMQEAIWTRFLPARHIVRAIMDSGVLGEIQSLRAEFSCQSEHIQRMYDPALAGGALLDLGMYAITFASMYFGDDVISMQSVCEKYSTGVDVTDEIRFTYSDGKIADLRTSFADGPTNEATIYGTKGSLHIPVINNYQEMSRFDKDGNLVEKYPVPEQVNGYEYEVLASIDAMEQGKLECEEMTHAKTLLIMKWMDELLKEWGVEYPFD